MQRYAPIKRDYDEMGFAIIRGFLPAEEIPRLKGEVERYVRETVPSAPASEVIREADGTNIRNLFQMNAHDAFFRELGDGKRFLDLAEALIDDTPEIKAVQTFNKPARVGSAVPQHQDNAYFCLHPPAAVTIWIAVDQATSENGAVQYVAGSHRRGPLEHRYSGQPGNSMMMRKPLDQSAHQIVKALLSPGDIVAHGCRTVHFSGPNRSDKPRLGMVIPYQGKSVGIDASLKRLYDEVASLIGRPPQH